MCKPTLLEDDYVSEDLYFHTALLNIYQASDDLPHGFRASLDVHRADP